MNVARWTKDGELVLVCRGRRYHYYGVDEYNYRRAKRRGLGAFRLLAPFARKDLHESNNR